MRSNIKDQVVTAIRESTGDLSALEVIFDNGMTLPRGKSRDEILIAAVESSLQNDTLGYLLDKGIVPDRKALNRATELGYTLATHKLVSHGAKIVSTAAVNAAKHKNVELLHIVLSHYPKPVYKKGSAGLASKLVDIVAGEGSLSLLKYLFETYEIPISKGTAGYNAFVSAVKANNQPNVDWLIEKNVALHAGNDSIGSTDYLKYAMTTGDMTLVRKVEQYLDHRNYPTWSVPDKLGYRAQRDLPEQPQDRLAVAIESGDIKQIEYCLERGSSLNKTCNKYNPLYYAAKNDNLPLLKYLVEQGANGKEGGSPLAPAIAHFNMPMVEYLFGLGHQPYADWGYCTALSIKNPDNRMSMLNYLAKHGLRPNQVREKQDPPLEYAAKHNRVAETRWLLDHGADATKGTPVLAAERSDPRIMQMLIDHGADVWVCDNSRVGHALRKSGSGWEITPENRVIVTNKMIEELAVSPDASERLKKKIGALKPGMPEFDAFSDLLEDAVGFSLKIQDELQSPPKIISALLDTPDSFVSLRSKLSGSTENKAGDMKDMIKEFISYVLIPSAILLTKQEQNPHVLDDSEILSNERQKRLMDRASHALFKNKTMDKALLLSDHWHGDQHRRFPDELRPLAARGEWYKITDDFVIPEGQPLAGYQVVFLDSVDALKDEGERMKHCVGSYASSCLEGKSFIWSIRNPQGESISTFEMARDSGFDRSEGHQTIDFKMQNDYHRAFRLLQHRGKENSDPPDEARRVFEAFKKTAEKEPLIHNFQSGATEETKKNAAKMLVHRHVGYEITWDNVEKAFDHYKKFRQNRRNYFIAGASNGHSAKDGGNDPTSHRDISVQEWLKETGLDRELIESMKKELPPGVYESLTEPPPEIPGSTGSTPSPNISEAQATNNHLPRRSGGRGGEEA